MTIAIEDAIARIPGWDKASSVRIIPLSGGTTNLNYRVDIDGEAFVVRLWAKGVELLGVDRIREYRCAVAASRTGVAPEVVHFLPEQGITVTRFLQGRRLSREEMTRPDVLKRVVQAMQRYHAGPPFEGTFSLFHAIDEYLQVAGRHRTPLPDDVDALNRRVCEIGAALQRGQALVRPCHNDLWWENLIDDGIRVHIVDWEYAAMGDACFDLASVARHYSPSGALDEALLQAYFGHVSPEAQTRLKLLKIAGEFREALWYVVAVHVASVTTGFAESARTHFDRCRQALADPRVQSWIDQTAHG